MRINPFKNSAASAQKEHRQFYFPLPVFLYAAFERFLERMSRNGWYLSLYSPFRFTFAKAAPKSRKFFIYHSGGNLSSDGKFSLSLRYGNILASYGAKPKESRLNSYTKSHLSHLSVIELREGADQEESFRELLRDRRRLYFAESLRDCLLAALAGLLLMFIGRASFLFRLGCLVLCLACTFILLSLISFLLFRPRSAE